MLQAVGGVGLDEPSVRIGQEVVDRKALRHVTTGLDSVDVVIRGGDALLRLEETLGGELKRRRQNQLHAAKSDLQATLVDERRDVDQGLLQRGLVEIGRSRQRVRPSAATNGGVRIVDQRSAVAAEIARGESVVEYRSALHLLGVGHGASQRLGVARAEFVVEVVLHGFLSDRERKCDGLVRIAGGESFTSRIIHDCRAFALHRGLTEARQHDLFLERTVRRLGVEDLSMLVVVAVVLHTEQGVKAGLEFLQEL